MEQEPRPQTNVEALFTPGGKYEFHLKTGIDVRGEFSGALVIENKWVINIIEEPTGYLRRIKYEEISTWTGINEQERNSQGTS